MVGQGGKAAAAANLAMLREGAVAYACVLLWIALSATVIMFNKYLLTYSGEASSRQGKCDRAAPACMALPLRHMSLLHACDHREHQEEFWS